MSSQWHCPETKIEASLDKQQILGRRDDNIVGYGFIVLYVSARSNCVLLLPQFYLTFVNSRLHYQGKSQWQHFIPTLFAAVHFSAHWQLSLLPLWLLSELILVYLCFIKISTPEAWIGLRGKQTKTRLPTSTDADKFGCRPVFIFWILRHTLSYFPLGCFASVAVMERQPH